MVNVVGTSTCIIGITPAVNLVPGVCGVVEGSVHPLRTGIEAGLSAVGDIFNAIATRAGTTVEALSRGLENYRAGQTGLLRMTWDNGDRTVLVNPNLRGITLGWNLQSTAQDELFAAIEGTAFHTRVILNRMAEHRVSINRVINAGGIPQKNNVLNQVYANVLQRPVLVPSSSVVGLGSAIFAFMAAESCQRSCFWRRLRLPACGFIASARLTAPSTPRRMANITGSNPHPARSTFIPSTIRVPSRGNWMCGDSSLAIPGRKKIRRRRLRAQH